MRCKNVQHSRDISTHFQKQPSSCSNERLRSMRWSEWWISEQEKWTLLWSLVASGIIPNTNHKRKTKSQNVNVNAGCVTILSGPHFTPPHPTGTPLCRETYARDNRAIHSENSLLFLLYIVSSLNKSTNYNGIWRRHFHIRITYFVSLFSEMFAARMRTRFFTRCDLQWCILQHVGNLVPHCSVSTSSKLATQPRRFTGHIW